jgi:hypothetical protein
MLIWEKNVWHIFLFRGGAVSEVCVKKNEVLIR